MAVRVPNTAVCLGCGYSLRGLPEPICPECGRPFNPGNPRSYKDPAAPRPWHAWAATPPVWLVGILATVMLIAVYSASLPRLPYPYLDAWQFWPLLFAIGPTVDFILRGIAALIILHRRRKAGTPIPRMKRWRWLAVPLCLLLTVSALLTDWPLQARFRLSLPAFEKAARQHLGRTVCPAGPYHIGLYHVRRVFSDDQNTVYFFVGRGKNGFIYRADDPRGWGIRRLVPRWYLW